ncbi:hypothetical protein ABVG11_15175 [Streptomyces sp. HD1123-B1]|uniref:hypothetical protein n=1 Tax=Streptomyces huangiella TaxID=3228804 RepID=UPI003D7EA846
MALVIGFGSDGEFRNDIEDQASERITVTAAPGETVTVTETHRITSPGDND